ncbi:MAG: type II secretion system F family protein [Chloroflexi bacterium]|nr:MAG: type II secretion system F family protein [Chloroflexota bacterium]
MTAELGALALAVAVLFGALALASLRHGSLIRDGLVKASTFSPPEWRQHQRQSASWYERWGRPLALMWANRLRLRPVKVNRDFLIQSGVNPDRFTGIDLRALKVAAAGTGVVAGLILLPLDSGLTPLIPLLGWVGYIAPNRYLSNRRRRRQRQVLTELPDFIGLVRAFVTAGVPLERALHLIASQDQYEMDQPILATEVRAALARYGLGLSLDEALEEMSGRIGIDDVRLFIAALSQGHRLGIGLQRLLHDQELMARMNQRNRATAEAARVGTKLLGVLAGVYLPEFVILIMIPLFWGIVHRAFG